MTKLKVSLTIIFCLYRLRYAGENFVRHSGDVKSFAHTQSKTMH